MLLFLSKTKDLAQWPSLSCWLADGKWVCMHSGVGTWGENMPPPLREDESKWWTGQRWKIGSPLWGFSKAWLIYLAGNDGMEGSPFPCFNSRQVVQGRGDLQEYCVHFFSLLALGFGVVKKGKVGSRKKKNRAGSKRGHKWDWGKKSKKDRGKKAGRKCEGGRWRISSG